MTILAPSILSADFTRLGEDITMIQRAGADWVHIDVMDGHFVPNITIGPIVIKNLKKMTTMLLDVHLMIENPDNYVDEFVKCGADLISIHAEASTHLHRSIQKIKAHGIKAGVALNPATPIAVLDCVIGDIDLVLLMSVNPGFGGQKFIPATINKIMKLKEKLNKENPKCLLQVDGGINPENAAELVNAGVDVLVSGAAIYESQDPAGVIRKLKSL